MPKPKGKKVGKNVTLNWLGDAVQADVLKAAKLGVEDILVDCVADAQPNTPYRTGALHDSERTSEDGVKIQGNVVYGEWGSYGISYALAVETGNRALIPPGSFVEDADQPETNFTRTSRNEGNKNFLRGAADKNYPNLSKRVKAHYESGT